MNREAVFAGTGKNTSQKPKRFPGLPLDEGNPAHAAVHRFVFFELNFLPHQGARFALERMAKAHAEITLEAFKLQLVTEQNDHYFLFRETGNRKFEIKKGAKKIDQFLKPFLNGAEWNWLSFEDFPEGLGKSLQRMEVVNTLFYCDTQIKQMFELYSRRWVVPDHLELRQMNPQEMARAKVAALAKIVRMIELVDDSKKLDVPLILYDMAALAAVQKILNLDDILGQCLSRVEAAVREQSGSAFEVLIERLRWSRRVYGAVRHGY